MSRYLQVVSNNITKVINSGLSMYDPDELKQVADQAYEFYKKVENFQNRVAVPRETAEVSVKSYYVTYIGITPTGTVYGGFITNLAAVAPIELAAIIAKDKQLNDCIILNWQEL